MRIEELVLEGFKSYPVRTQITGWDASFNAITGLNGTGKSNILDAISFVLGLTNMSTMRASNQTDLIYKRGQAGITKASVTIVFDNSDISKSPTGHESSKQITVTRQLSLPNVSKYLLNGHKVTQQQIQTLFQSVQLNINNPNFVIMQGKITKVLNMRPQEILGMVEEAAGTRMFEERKDKAIKTMSKKDKKVQEITSLLGEEITPKLDKLRKEKRKFLEFQKAETELQRIERVLRAWEWDEARQRNLQKRKDIGKKEAEIEAQEGKKDEFQHECDAAEAEKQEVEEKRNREQAKGGKLAKLEETVTQLDKDLVRTRTQVDLKKTSIKDEEARVAGCRAELTQLEASLAEKKTQVDELNTAHKTVKDKHAGLTEKLATAEELLQSLLTGLSNNKDNKATGGGGYMGQLATARQQAAQAAAEEKQARVKLGMSESELKTVEARWKTMEREAGDGKKKLEGLRVTVEGCRNKVAQCAWSEEKENASERNMQELKARVQSLERDRERIHQGLSYLDFKYALGPHFDRQKVKGRVALLLKLARENYPSAQALEMTAGSKLQSVVVDDEKVAKDLLNSRLERKVHLIPLNKIEPRTISTSKLRAAEQIGEGKVRTALSLVNYPANVSKAIEFVFSDTLICDTPEIAKKVTFADAVKLRSVTLAGDVYEPSGSLSGGSAPNSTGVLIRVQELLEADDQLDRARAEQRELENTLAKSQKIRDEWKARAKELDMREHELNLMEEQMQGSNAAKLGAQVDTLKQTITELKAAIQTALDKQAEANENCDRLQRDMEEFKNNKDGKIDELKADISKQKAALQKHSVILKTQQKEQQTAALELEQMETDLEATKITVEEANSGVASLKDELAKLERQLTKEKAAYDEAHGKLQEERATLKRFDNELLALDRVIKEKKQAINKAELAIQKLGIDIQNLNKEANAAANMAANLEKEHEWIEEDKPQFGKQGGQYDFAANNMPELKTRVEELSAQTKGMKKTINPKVLAMIDNIEKKEAGLKKMLTTVMKDKQKIEETIEELDRYKREALETTWKKVDGDFGGIFAELLPGNFAKLQPPEDQDLMDGLEVKVRLGSVWKQSLTELSGGQRSLIALSLIMSLLQFKPAPMYILDEIDAALDLSHTQHIGQLFRTRFKGSQFIVVSLKEGLFTNANVLFKTRFRDGTSIVERTAQRSSSSMYDK
ncbi:Structural maintenance of chromosomes protein [Mycena sanguinolenta]|uniref:Structural maintenance of chromosomes protein n=1 Tax=Mycena sanguinolenta TaxID=230812 RepID=A0A8H6ZA34_9AGAR|nr:Structural maintenance of chromosomes protein [Mycena sanguinolenta]